MHFLIVADLHANWPALQAVIADANGKFDRIICCGDLVGYNPHPAKILDWTRKHCAAIIRGNHDKLVAGMEDMEWFNEIAQAAAIWTIGRLNEEQLDYLRNLPQGPRRLEHFHICHGSPMDEDQYIATPREAAACFAHFELPLAFFGHTHVQGGFFLRHGRIGRIPQVRKKDAESVIALDPDAVYMVNPGSVGQPRDGDPRAAYALYDSDQRIVTLRRLEYSIDTTAKDIKQAGLPDVLAFRLFQGL